MKLTVLIGNKNKITIKIKDVITVRELKEAIHQKLSLGCCRRVQISEEYIVLKYNNDCLKDDKYVNDYHIKDGCNIPVHIQVIWKERADKTIPIILDYDDSVSKLISKIHDENFTVIQNEKSKIECQSNRLVRHYIRQCGNVFIPIVGKERHTGNKIVDVNKTKGRTDQRKNINRHEEQGGSSGMVKILQSSHTKGTNLVSPSNQIKNDAEKTEGNLKKCTNKNYGAQIKEDPFIVDKERQIGVKKECGDVKDYGDKAKVTREIRSQKEESKIKTKMDIEDPRIENFDGSSESMKSRNLRPVLSGVNQETDKDKRKIVNLEVKKNNQTKIKADTLPTEYRNKETTDGSTLPPTCNSRLRCSADNTDRNNSPRNSDSDDSVKENFDGSIEPTKTRNPARVLSVYNQRKGNDQHKIRVPKIVDLDDKKNNQTQIKVDTLPTEYRKTETTDGSTLSLQTNCTRRPSGDNTDRKNSPRKSDYDDNGSGKFDTSIEPPNKCSDISPIKQLESVIHVRVNNNLGIGTSKDTADIVIDRNGTISDLRGIISRELQTGLSDYIIYYSDILLVADTISQLKDNNTLVLLPTRRCEDFVSQFVITVANCERGTTQRYLISEFETVGALKIILREQYNVNVNCMRLLYNGIELDDERIIREMGIESGAQFEVQIDRMTRNESGVMRIMVRKSLCAADDVFDNCRQIEVDSTESVGSVRRKIDSVLGISPDLVGVLSFNGEILRTDNLISTYNIADGDVIVVTCSVFVRYFAAGDNHSAKVNRYAFVSTDKVADLKMKIMKKLNIAIRFISLTFDGSVLIDDMKLEDVGVENESYLLMVSTLAGG